MKKEMKDIKKNIQMALDEKYASEMTNVLNKLAH